MKSSKAFSALILVSACQISCIASLALGCELLGRELRILAPKLSDSKKGSDFQDDFFA